MRLFCSGQIQRDKDILCFCQLDKDEQKECSTNLMTDTWPHWVSEVIHSKLFARKIPTNKIKMEYIGNAKTALKTPSPPTMAANSDHDEFSPPPPPQAAVATAVVLSPCAACKILRRRCVEKCVLAPYFPPTDPRKFTIAHRVFGASNIIKFLQELPESQRSDAVSSMVYEANARIRDPVYGCAGAVCQLQKQVSELQAQLAKAQAELVNMQLQQANLLAIFCMEIRQSNHNHHHHHDHDLDQPITMVDNMQHQPYQIDTTCFLDDSTSGTWETLWT